MNSDGFLKDLGPTAEKLMEKHLNMTKEWFPHEMVPWSIGRDFTPGEKWDETEHALPEGVRSALFVNLLTEDNLPYYFNALDVAFSRDGIWGEWARRWTAEEHRHSIVLRDYLTVTRMVDPVVLERARMDQVSTGIIPEPVSPEDTVAYVALQELATRVVHRNTGKMVDEPMGYAIMARIAADENLHYIFYRDITQVSLDRDPNVTMEAIERQVRSFAMPGTGIQGFAAHAMAIAKAGIYDFALHYEQVIKPVVLRSWKVESLTGLDARGERARERLMKFISRLEIAARRVNERKEEITSGLIISH